MKYMEQTWNSISRSEKICFFSSLFWGFVTHMYMLTNKLPNWDDLGNFNGYGVGGEFGRFMLKPLNRLTVSNSNPWINGTAAIVLIAAACVLIYRMLGLESTICGLLLPLTVMTFPGLVSTMTFMFTVDLYAMGIFLAVLAAFLVTKQKIACRIAAVVFMVVSMGVYQSYICFTITLLLLYVLKKLLDGEDLKKQLREGILYAVLLAAGTLSYMIAARIKYPGLSKESYNGVGTMGSVSLFRLPRLIAKAYLRFIRYFILGDYSFITRSWQIVNILILSVMALLWIMLLYRIRKDRLRLVFAAAVTILLPLGNSFVDVMAPDAAFSMIMLYQYCLVYVALLGMAEWVSGEDDRLPVRGVAIAAVLLLCVMGYKQYQLAGEAYFRMDLSYRRSSALLQRIIVRVEEQEGYREGDSIRILGDSENVLPSSQSAAGKKYSDLSGVALEHGMLTPGAREQFAALYLGVKLERSYGEEADRIRESAEYREMDCYPAGQCMKKIDGCWIVKLSDE